MKKVLRSSAEPTDKTMKVLLGILLLPAWILLGTIFKLAKRYM